MLTQSILLDPGELRYFIEMANVDDLKIYVSGATVVFTKPVTLIQVLPVMLSLTS